VCVCVGALFLSRMVLGTGVFHCVSQGSGTYGQLGHGAAISQYSKPLVIKGIPEELQVSRIACGDNHSAVVTSCSKLYTCMWLLLPLLPVLCFQSSACYAGRFSCGSSLSVAE
jgi:Regulator of chromosome condensation (RCC1) repeat